MHTTTTATAIGSRTTHTTPSMWGELRSSWMCELYASDEFLIFTPPPSPLLMC
jgi:hypothetical protein